jgi:NAD(P)-dependent dehydrogenase (short-subunit alcohol dehydrogenase family)
MHNPISRRLAIVTGAYGGMGQAVSRLFGAEMDLALTGNSQNRLDAFAQVLEHEGFTVRASIGGSLENSGTLDALGAAVDEAGGFGALVHTAGVSPAQSDWRRIVTVNLVATERLLRKLEQGLLPGSAAVLISSMGGHMAPADPAIDAVLAEPLADGLFEKLGPLLAAHCDKSDAWALGSAAYLSAKREVIRICERRAVEWGRKGARIVSISPGMIKTPMALRETAENLAPRAVLAATPLGRWGTPMDIAAVARFLASDAASFVSGCDLRVDGGVTAALFGASF